MAQFYFHEEDIAFEIWIATNNRFRKNAQLSVLDNSFLKELNFEIINDFYNKDVIFSYVLKDRVNIRNIELSLMALGIQKQFSDKSVPDKKQYLAVWK